MDITMVRIDSRVCLKLCLNLFTMAPIVSLPLVHAAESSFIPGINASVYGYELEQDSNSGKDRGAALELSPYVSWIRKSQGVESSLKLQYERVQYRDNERDNRGFTQLDFVNQFYFFDRRVMWRLDARQDYLLRNTRQGVFSDKITAADDLSRGRSLASGFSYQNHLSANYQAQAEINFRRQELDTPINDDGLGKFKTDTFNGQWLFGSNARGLNFYWQYRGQIQEVERNVGANISVTRNQGLVGMPIAPRISIIGRAGFERADNSFQYANQFDYFGAGVEFRFGAKSRINVTMNRSDSSAFDEKKQTDTYAAAEFLIAPSRRTQIEGSFDRRFFGRTLDLNGRYDLRFLSMRLQLKDEVRAQNLLDRETSELGLFVCEQGFTDLASCFRPPTNKYVPVFGEQFQQITIVSTELREALVEVRNFGFNLAYNRSRLVLGLSLNDLETVYVEQDDSSRNRNIRLQASWQLDDYSKLLTNIDFYKIDYTLENRKDDNLSLTVGYDVKLSNSSNIRVSLRRLERESNIQQFISSENRIWLDYRYRFN